MTGHKQAIITENKLLFLAIIAIPIFAIVNPVSFFLGYINCFEETDTPFVYVPNFTKYFAIALIVFVVITLLKYPLFKLKRKFAGKPQSIALFYLFHSASQIPYLMLLSVFYNYWGPRDLNDVGFGFFLWYFVVAIASWIASFCVFNLLTYTYPRDPGASID